MNARTSSRALLLEQLESRCLFAAGAFEHSVRQTDNPSDRSVTDGQHHQPAWIGVSPAANFQHPQSHFDRNHVGQRLEVFSLERQAHARPRMDSLVSSRLDIPEQSGIRPRPAFPMSPVLQFATTSQSVEVWRPEISESGNVNSLIAKVSMANATHNAPRQGFIENVLPISGSANSSPTAEALLPVREATQMEKLPSARHLKVEGFSNAPLVPVSKGFSEFSSPVDGAGILPQLVQSSSDPVRATNQVGKSIGGTIALGPSTWHGYKPHKSSDEVQFWRLDTNSIRDLGEIANKSSLKTAGNPYDSIDSVIANWFGQPTGLIDDIHCQHDLPMMLNDLSPTIVDVALDATVGLHRSCGLIASTDVKTHSNTTRDAILAVFAAKSPAFTETPPEQGLRHYSGLGYGGAAMVSATLLLADRRRRQSKLESTIDQENRT